MYPKRNNLWEVMDLYTEGYKNSFYLREISKLLKIPLKTSQNIMQFLESENIVKSAIKGKNKYFTLNLDNVKTKFFLLHAEIFKTLNLLEIYPVLNPFLKELKSFDVPVLAFGSFADFTATKDSDLDLLIVSDSLTNLPYHLLPYKVHEIKMSKKTFFQSINNDEPLMTEIIKNHVIFIGYDYFVNAWWEKYGR